jgi:pilus assembly protein CpaB
MNRQTLIALLLAVIAALLTYYYISEKEAAVEADVTPIKVLVAKKPLPRGAALTADKILIDEIPGSYVMPGAISAPDKEGVIKQWKKYKGQFAIVPLAKGEQILPNKLSQILPGFAGVVPEGMRIISLAFDLSAAIGGHVRPGNHVDIIGTFEHQYKKNKQITTVLMAQNILVTAVGDETTSDKPKIRKGGAAAGSSGSVIVCLSVAPADAVRLALAEEEGRLKLALRSVGDENKLDLPDQNLGTVLGPLMKVRKEEIRPVKKQIQIIRGLQ